MRRQAGIEPVLAAPAHPARHFTAAFTAAGPGLDRSH